MILQRPDPERRFTDDPANEKTGLLTGAVAEAFIPDRTLMSMIDAYAEACAARGETAKILDFGCGRGDFVAYLRRGNLAAYGVDIDERYVRNGAAILGIDNKGVPILSVIDAHGRTRFCDGEFGLVVSNQVFEHVRDMSAVAKEISRVTRLSGQGLHVFPARYRFVEPHLLMPLVHRLPKNSLRRVAIAVCIKMGVGKKSFTELKEAERCRVYYDFSVSQTFYRPQRIVRNTLGRHGLTASFKSGIALKIGICRHAGIRRLLTHPAALTLLSLAYSTFVAAYLKTDKDTGAPI